MEETKIMVYEGQGQEIRNPIGGGSIYNGVPIEVKASEAERLLKYPGFRVVEPEIKEKKKVKEV